VARRPQEGRHRTGVIAAGRAGGRRPPALPVVEKDLLGKAGEAVRQPRRARASLGGDVVGAHDALVHLLLGGKQLTHGLWPSPPAGGRRRLFRLRFRALTTWLGFFGPGGLPADVTQYPSLHLVALNDATAKAGGRSSRCPVRAEGPQALALVSHFHGPNILRPRSLSERTPPSVASDH